VATFDLNGRAVSVRSPDDTPLLWVIRDEFGLTGTKFGCGIGMCGACTVHVEGRATRSCITAVRTRSQWASSAANGMDRSAGSAMWLLPVRPDHAGGRSPEGLSESDR